MSNSVLIACDKSFKTKASMRRHQIHRCSINNKFNIDKLIKNQNNDSDLLCDKLQMLIDRIGNKVNNNTSYISILL